jgi:hypothetical protein
VFRYVLAALLCVAALAPARAAGPPMSFTLARGGGECDPDCPEWIAAQGEILPNSAAQLRAFLDKLDGRRRPLLINSGGGSVEAAIQMGRLIRARKLAVAVAATRFFEPPAAYNLVPASPSLPKSGFAYSYPAACASACTLVLAAGVERYASAIALVGVHEVKQNKSQTFVLRKYLVHYRIIDGRKEEISREVVSEDRNTVHSTAVNPADVNQRLAAYLKEMGVDAKLIAIMQTATPEQIHRMTPEEETATQLVTVFMDAPMAMALKPADNGLSGAGARATLDAEQSWPLEPAADGEERAFAAHFTLRRGGGGVVATYTLLNPLHGAPLRYGVTPRAPNVRRLSAPDPRTATVFLPATAFCRYMRVGDLGVKLAFPDPPPTQAPGLPDPRAPLLRVPFASVHGVAALAQELCGDGKALVD